MAKIYLPSIGTRLDNAYNARLAIKHKLDDVIKRVDILNATPDPVERPETTDQGEPETPGPSGARRIGPPPIPDVCYSEGPMTYENLTKCFSNRAFFKKVLLDLQYQGHSTVVVHVLDKYTP